MPFRAIDEKTNQAYPIEWFLKNGKVAGVCGYCGTLMTIKANHTSDKRAHFWHGSGDSNCPTITKNGSAYEGLEGGTLDKEAGLQMIQLVNNNMFQIYLACMKIINKSLFFSEFKEWVLKANAKKVWDYKGITLEYVPYILLTFAEKLNGLFPGVKGGVDYRIIFDPKLKTFDNLWIASNQKQNILKIDKNSGDILEVAEISKNPFADLEPDYFKKFKL
ncbi:TPA: hypothetical protein ACHKB2_001767 [Acinetobacter baumannii]|uniref:hypothetical protein n=1 Tax=Acinetobacter baumannii TaxID=470 RepID=UPI0010228B01|nr:hypothetical protein [Acinetobacter baumannii]RYL19468.1 hypothetical protein EWO92_00235 [Acinetobacter baumannii]RYL32829.1 hypothetical protein EWO96_03580 [Acinetobacter baumannii]RYL45949.1 hypothetical protein EWP49_03580 [Acinetobacter baumannii]